MRVVDGLTIYDMTKKKPKVRQLTKDGPSDDSSADAGSRCSHVAKATNCTGVQKALKQRPYAEHCMDCVKDGINQSHEGAATFDSAIWMCLQCAYQGCGRDSPQQHALKHYQTPRSTSHCVVVNMLNWTCWCYDCDNEVAVERYPPLLKAVECIRKFCVPASTGKKECPSIDAKDVPASRKLIDSSACDTAATGAARISGASNMAGVVPLPKLKGLNNLGNTCFFNAILQNLCQTYLLEQVLHELARKDATFKLPGFKYDPHVLHEGDDYDGCDNTAAKDHARPLSQLEALTVPVSGLGELTSAVRGFITDMSSSTKGSTVSPSNLFSQVCKKAPRFKGLQQQDSHELLRYLLDGMRCEEIANRKRGILKLFNIRDPASKDIDEEKKAKLKAYGVQLRHTFVDSIFGGHLLSSVLCQECGHASQIFEPFLDLSLPVVESKGSTVSLQHNNHSETVWSTKQQIANKLTEDTPEVTTKPNMSKHQRKILKQQAKKERKAKKNQRHVGGDESKTAEDHSAALAEEGPADREEEDDRLSQDVSKDNDADANIDTPASSCGTGALERIAALRGGSCIDACDGPHGESDSENCCSSASERLNVLGIEVPDKECTAPYNKDVDCICPVTAHSLNDSPTTVEDTEDVDKLPAVPGTNFLGSNVLEVALASSFKSLCLGGGYEPINEQKPNVSPDVAPAASQPSGQNGCLTNGHVCTIGACTPVSLGMADAQSDSSVLDIDRACGADLGAEQPSAAVYSAAEPLSCNADKEQQCCVPLSQAADQPAETGAHAAELTCGATRSDEQLPAAVPAIERSLSRILRDAVKTSLTTLGMAQQRAGNTLTLLSCLEQFTADEHLTGANKFQCKSCTRQKQREAENDEARRGASGGKKELVYSNAVKQLLVFSPPAVLTLHLKRFQQVGHSLRKVNSHVEFPVRLDLAPFCSSLCMGVQPGQKHVLYSLYGVVEHSGQLSRGHYTAYVRSTHDEGTGSVTAQKQFLQAELVNYEQPLHTLVDRLQMLRNANGAGQCATNSSCTAGSCTTEDGAKKQCPLSIAAASGKWFHISDNHVSEVSEAAVLACQAYILFYERTD